METTLSPHIAGVLPFNAILPRAYESENQWQCLCLLEFIGVYTHLYDMAIIRITVLSAARGTEAA